VRVVRSVVLAQGGDDRAVDVGACGHRGALEYAAQEGAVGVERQAQLPIDEAAGADRGVRGHVARQAELAVPGGRQEIELAALLADQHVGAGDVGAASQVKADKRDLAGPRDDVAGTVLERCNVGRERRVGLARVGKQGEGRSAGEGNAARDETLGQELASRDRPRVIGVAERFVQAQGSLASDLHDRPRNSSGQSTI
jgi:hypothetical protein